MKFSLVILLVLSAIFGTLAQTCKFTGSQVKKPFKKQHVLKNFHRNFSIFSVPLTINAVHKFVRNGLDSGVHLPKKLFKDTSIHNSTTISKIPIGCSIHWECNRCPCNFFIRFLISDIRITLRGVRKVLLHKELSGCKFPKTLIINFWNSSIQSETIA